jgi:hypothetical protein
MEDPLVRRRVRDLLQAAALGLVGGALVAIGASGDAEAMRGIGGVCLFIAVVWAVVALWSLSSYIGSDDHSSG